MALVLGTNCGFVTVAPTSNPSGVNLTIDNNAFTTKDTSPATAAKITEIGWWCDSSTPEVNFEVGLYAADGVVVPGEAGTRLHVDTTNAKGTTSGWKRVTGLNWAISASTAYWLAVQLDNTNTTNTNFGPSGGGGRDKISPATSLPNPFGGGGLDDNDGIITIYVVWEAATGTNMQINIADAWKDVTKVEINVGDVWKEATKVEINIGDTWKTIF